MQRKDLDSGDKGKGARQGWYAYGRTQGLNKYGKNYYFQHLQINLNSCILMNPLYLHNRGVFYKIS